MLCAEDQFTPSASRPAPPAAVLEGIAGYVPAEVVTNDELPSAWGIDDAWVRRRTGIRERRRAAPGVSTGELALEAGSRALAVAGGAPVDTVIVATSTPDRPMPAMAPRLATRLGLGGAAAWDVSAACSGFLYGLATTAGALLCGCADRVLLVAADVYSTLLDPEDRSTGIVFGDGAGAVVLRRGRAGEPGSILAFDLGSDGSGDELIEVPGGGARERSTPAGYGPEDRYFRMRGREVFQHAVTRMTRSSQAVLKHAGWAPEEVDRFCAHQANARILTAVGERVPVPEPRGVSNIDRVGNTGAASIPLALADAASRGELHAGEKVLLTTFGAGLTWGSAALLWPRLAHTVPGIEPTP
ncbi:beta-ketoacyl-ACP synthase 3 [Streptomyces sp. NBC_00424]|uniref:beta-ketoacyl-ACP synthase 3 n=1 Tax=Streptomyces sp. NBC_00424 TaxID=2903648 RepID=UPI00224DECD5|nr:beta-ketoacyl-ACP synthase 3 [Streptomyces sp. NBC_00424]MCX5078111.1 beta-ketoacyl-ACP synthase 3 [Streptomyces sp. NBC_00424]